MILYEDKDILICHKPAGIPVQSASVRQKDMVSILHNPLGAPVHVVHRLDQPGEGVIAFAKTQAAAAELSRQIADGSMKKTYWAIVEVQETGTVIDDLAEAAKARGAVVADDLAEAAKAKGAVVADDLAEAAKAMEAVLVNYLVKDGQRNLSFVSEKTDRRAKRAELSFQVLRIWNEAEAGRRALLEIHLKTGRHHQIRVQLSHAGLPLLGDRKYNRGRGNEQDGDARNARMDGNPATGLALCAVSLTLRHPTTKKPLTFRTKPNDRRFPGITVLGD